MTKDEIIRKARKVWGEQAILPFDDLERFAAFVAAKAREEEREACAKVCDSWSLKDSLAADMAEEIRSRGNSETK